MTTRSTKARRMSQLGLSASVLIGICLLPVSARALHFETFDAPDCSSPRAVGVNLTGAVAGYCDRRARRYFAFVRAPDGTITPFNVNDSKITVTSGINAGGDIVGSYLVHHAYHAYLRTPDGNVTPISVPGQMATGFQIAINDKGTIAGDCYDGQRHGFLRNSSGRFTIFDFPGAPRLVVITDISNDNAVVGYYTDSTGINQGFLRTRDGTFTTFDPDASQGTYPQSINTDGTISGSYDNASGKTGFVRDAQGKITIFGAPEGGTKLYWATLNNRGAIAGYYEDPSSFVHGYVRQPDGTMTKLDVPDSATTYPQAINDNGEISGFFENQALHSHGFVMIP